MAAFFKLFALLFLTGVCQGQVSVTSSFEIDGRSCAGMDEVVVFTCRIEAGSLLEWTVSPLINVTNAILFFASANPNTIIFRPGVNARVLEPDGSLLVSELRIDAILAEDTLVFCRNGDPEAAVSTVYCRRDGSNLPTPPGIDVMEESAGNEEGTAFMLEAISVCLNWSEADNITEIDFLGYQVSVVSLRSARLVYSAQVSTNEARVTLRADTYDVTVSVVDLNGNVGVPVRRTITLNAQSNDGLIATTVLAVIFFVCCICVCFCTCLYILCKPRFKAEDGGEDSAQLRKTIATQEETIRDLRAKLLIKDRQMGVEMTQLADEKPVTVFRGTGSVSDAQ